VYKAARAGVRQPLQPLAEVEELVLVNAPCHSACHQRGVGIGKLRVEVLKNRGEVRDDYERELNTNHTGGLQLPPSRARVHHVRNFNLGRVEAERRRYIGDDTLLELLALRRHELLRLCLLRRAIREFKHDARALGHKVDEHFSAVLKIDDCVVFGAIDAADSRQSLHASVVVVHTVAHAYVHLQHSQAGVHHEIELGRQNVLVLFNRRLDACGIPDQHGILPRVELPEVSDRAVATVAARAEVVAFCRHIAAAVVRQAFVDISACRSGHV
jgi:hypothetical protein